MKTICLACGKEFNVFPAELRRGNGKFCSRACSNTFTKSVEKIKVVCSKCGKPLYRYPSAIKESKTGKHYCEDCGKQVELKCKWCGKIFYLPPSLADHHNNLGKFCSRECADKGRTKTPRKSELKITLNCEVCGIEFFRYPADLRKHSSKWFYCSKNCAAKHMVKENNPAWQGGLSFKPYCPKFDEKLKEIIRNQYNRTCQKCGEKEGGRRLDVHHINFDKQSGCFGKPWNLIPLHQKCHTWTTHHRFEAFNLFTNHWLNLYIDFNSSWCII